MSSFRGATPLVHLLESPAADKIKFVAKVAYDGAIFRTPSILEVFSSKAAPLKEKRLLIIEQPLQKVPKNMECSPKCFCLESFENSLHLFVYFQISSPLPC